MKAGMVAPLDATQQSRLRVLLALFGLVWLINAGFQAVAWLAAPNASTHFIHALAKSTTVVPRWVQPLLMTGLHSAQSLGLGIVAAIMVLLAILLGLALLTQRKVAFAARVGIIYSIICWIFLDGFGFPYANGQTDPGVFVAYAIAFLFVLSVAPVFDREGTKAPEIDERLWHWARIAFGLLWLFDAVLKWIPPFLLHFSSQITSVIPGQPHWIAAWLSFVAELVHAIGPIPVAVVVALAETAIAIGLLSGRWMRLVIPVGMLYSVAVWTTAEAFGGPYSTAGTGVRGNVLGNVLIYLIPFLFLWVGNSSQRSAAETTGRTLTD